MASSIASDIGGKHHSFLALDGFDPKEIYDTIASSPLLEIITVAGFASASAIGANDFANAMGTAVGSGALSLRNAKIFGGMSAVIGATFFGQETAATVKSGFWDRSKTQLNDNEFLAALGSAVIAASAWVYYSTAKGWPVSSTHSIIGGLLGVATVADLIKTGDTNTIGNGVQWPIVGKVIGSWVGSPVLGGLAAVGTYGVLKQIPIPQKFWVPFQITSSMAVAFSIGSNDIANAVGPFAAGYEAVHDSRIKGVQQVSAEASVPTWMRAGGGLAIFLGMSLFGKNVTKTIATDITEINACMGFSAEIATAGTVFLASKMGIPVSTTHTLVGAIVGLSMVYSAETTPWQLLRTIGGAWVLSLPVAAILSAGTYLFVEDLLVNDRKGPPKEGHGLYAPSQLGKNMARTGRWMEDFIVPVLGHSSRLSGLLRGAGLWMGGAYGVVSGIEEESAKHGLKQGMYYFLSAAPFGSVLDILNGASGFKHGETMNRVSMSRKEAWFSLASGTAALVLDILTARAAIRRSANLPRVDSSGGVIESSNRLVRRLLSRNGRRTNDLVKESPYTRDAIVNKYLQHEVKDAVEKRIRRGLGPRYDDVIQDLRGHEVSEELVRKVEWLSRRAHITTRFLNWMMKRKVVPEALAQAVKASHVTSDIQDWLKVAKKFANGRIDSINKHPVLWTARYLPGEIAAVPGIIIRELAKTLATGLGPYAQYMGHHFSRFFNAAELARDLKGKPEPSKFRLLKTPEIPLLEPQAVQGVLANYNFRPLSIAVPEEVSTVSMKYGVNPEWAYFVVEEMLDFGKKEGNRTHGVRARLSEKFGANFETIQGELASKIARDLTPEKVEAYLNSEKGRGLSDRLVRTGAAPRLGASAVGLMMWLGADSVSDMLELHPIYEREKRFVLALALATGATSASAGPIEVLTNEILKRPYSYVTSKMVASGEKAMMEFTFHSSPRIHQAMLSAIFKNWNLSGTGAQIAMRGLGAVVKVPISFVASSGPGVMSYRIADATLGRLCDPDSLTRKLIGGSAFLAPAVVEFMTKGAVGRYLSRLGFAQIAKGFMAGFTVDLGTMMYSWADKGAEASYYDSLDYRASEIKDEAEGANRLEWTDAFVLPLAFKGLDHALEFITPYAAAKADSFNNWGTDKNEYWYQIREQDRQDSVKNQGVLREVLAAKLVAGDGNDTVEDYYNNVDLGSFVSEDEEVAKKDAVVGQIKKMFANLRFVALPVNGNIRAFVDDDGNLRSDKVGEFFNFVYGTEVKASTAIDEILFARKLKLAVKILKSHHDDLDTAVAKKIGLLDADGRFTDMNLFLMAQSFAS